jgi:hypothetical protein
MMARAAAAQAIEKEAADTQQREYALHTARMKMQVRESR